MTLFEPTPATAHQPGWQMIANREGAHGFHLVDRTTPDRGVVTVCGIVGRVVTAHNYVIATCPACAGTPLT
jgi:hypothetical protein